MSSMSICKESSSQPSEVAKDAKGERKDCTHDEENVSSSCSWLRPYSLSEVGAEVAEKENVDMHNYSDDENGLPNLFPQSREGGKEGKLMMNRMVVDIIELCCHNILVEEPSSKKLFGHFTQLGHYLSLLEDNEVESIYSHGRLHSRLNLAALIYDVLSIRRFRRKLHEGEKKKAPSDSLLPSFDDHYETGDEDSSDSLFSIDWKYEDWKRVEEQLVLAKSTLLPSKPVLTKRIVEMESDGQKVDNLQQMAEIKKSTDSSYPSALQNGQMVENLDLIEKKNFEVLCAIQVQAEIAKFRECLKGLRRDQQTKENHHSYQKELESAINAYASGLNEIFKGPSVVNDDDVFVDYSSEDNERCHLPPMKRIPTQLISFLLPVLYQKNAEESMPDHLLQHLEKRVILNPRHEFSCKRVQQKFLSLLVDWSDLMLDPPILVQQSASVVTDMQSITDDEDIYRDEVTSLCDGDDNEELLQWFEEDEQNDDQDMLSCDEMQIQVPWMMATTEVKKPVREVSESEIMEITEYDMDDDGGETISPSAANNNLNNSQHSMSSSSSKRKRTDSDVSDHKHFRYSCSGWESYPRAA